MKILLAVDGSAAADNATRKVVESTAFPRKSSGARIAWR